jgi:hypothetical protein
MHLCKVQAVTSVVSWWRAAMWLSVSKAKGEQSNGWWNASTMLAKLAKMRSVDKASSMLTLVETKRPCWRNAWHTL